MVFHVRCLVFRYLAINFRLFVLELNQLNSAGAELFVLVKESYMWNHAVQEVIFCRLLLFL